MHLSIVVVNVLAWISLTCVNIMLVSILPLSKDSSVFMISEEGVDGDNDRSSNCRCKFSREVIPTAPKRPTVVVTTDEVPSIASDAPSPFATLALETRGSLTGTEEHKMQPNSLKRTKRHMVNTYERSMSTLEVVNLHKLASLCVVCNSIADLFLSLQALLPQSTRLLQRIFAVFAVFDVHRQQCFQLLQICDSNS